MKINFLGLWTWSEINGEVGDIRNFDCENNCEVNWVSYRPLLQSPSSSAVLYILSWNVSSFNYSPEISLTFPSPGTFLSIPFTRNKTRRPLHIFLRQEVKYSCHSPSSSLTQEPPHPSSSSCFCYRPWMDQEWTGWPELLVWSEDNTYLQE